MADEKVLNSESSEVEDMTPDYVAAIKELKQNSVDKAKYDALRLENKKLLDAVVNGQTVEAQVQVQKEDIQTLRNKVFNNANQTNLEYISNVLNLRNRLLEEGFEDPFVPQGTQISATQADYDKANKVATVLQEIVGGRAGRANRSTEAAQGTECQNSAQHPSNHFLCPEAGSRAATDRPQSGRRLRVAEGGAQGNADASR